MKKFLKFLAISLCLALVTVYMAGCSGQPQTTLSGSYFLQSAGNVSIIGNVNEETVYDVTFTPSKVPAAQDVKIALIDEEGFNVYTTKLTNTTYEGTDCYLLETVLKTKISYTLYGEDLGSFEDTTTSKAYFLSVSNKLKPLYSETKVDANTPVSDKDGKYSVTNLKYSFSITYQNGTAIANFTPEKGEYGIPSGKREYKKYDSKNYYFDNVTMLFMPRAIKLTDSSSLSFSSIDALAGINRSMVMASDQKPSEDLIFSTTNTEEGVIPKAYYINNRKLFVNGDSQVVPCHVVNFAVSGKFSGTPIKCWYADTSDAVKDARARLMKMETTALYSLGTFTYIINKTTTEG